MAPTALISAVFSRSPRVAGLGAAARRRQQRCNYESFLRMKHFFTRLTFPEKLVKWARSENPGGMQYWVLIPFRSVVEKGISKSDINLSSLQPNFLVLLLILKYH